MTRYAPENQQFFGSDFWRWDAQHGAMIVTREGVMPYMVWREGKGKQAMWTNDGPALWLTANQQTVVPDGDPRAAFLLVTAGGQLDENEARKWGLIADEKAKAAPDNKAKTPPPNKKS